MQLQELIDTAETQLLTVTNRHQVVMQSGQGVRMRDTSGKEYLDFVGGWAVTCLGHSPQVIVEALSNQAELLVNSSPSYYNVPMLEYTKLLVDNTCLDRVFFASSGAEANEGAIKLARKYGQKHKNGAYEIITTTNAFHGRTLTTMSATGKPKWRDLYEPKTKGFKQAVFNDLESVKSLVNESTVAIMLEPIQGEGGVNVANLEFMQGLRELCDEHKLLLILDEVQTGFGRTGKLFGYQHYGIEPDIMTLAKGIAGGFPLSALMAKEFLNIFDPGDQGATYSSQPLAMAVGKAVLQELLDKNIADHAREMGQYLKLKLNEMAEAYAISNIRGDGLLIAFDILHNNAAEISNKCFDDGLLINACKPNSLRLMPPLIVKKNEIHELVHIIKKYLPIL